MSTRKHWSLGAKLALVPTPFLLLALVSIAMTLWVSWQLEGGTRWTFSTRLAISALSAGTIITGTG